MLALLALTGLHFSARAVDTWWLRDQRTQITADLAVLTTAERHGNAAFAITLLEARDRAGGERFLYRLTDPETGERIVGNLPDGLGAAGSDGWITGTVAGIGPVLARATRIDGHYPLMIARPVPTMGAVADNAWWWLIGSTAAIVTVALLRHMVVARRLRARLAHIEATLLAFQSGTLDARIDDPATDLAGRVGHGIDRCLAIVQRQFDGFQLFAERFAHELRGPVALAISRIDAADHPDTLAAACRVEVGRLLHVFDSILYLAALRTRPLHADRVALHTIAYLVVDLYTAAAAERGVTITADLAATPIAGEAALVERLVANLVANAVKFTAPDSEVTVATRIDGERATLIVADAGMGTAGLPDDPGSYLRRGPAAAGTQGAGLGLSAVLRIAEFHGAEVAFADRPGGGLVVTVAFPSARLALLARGE
ncbi:HAMP domain-containing sensor histidine kinase [Sphingomonas sp. VNH70]|uniref:sensor histidine kinase n=1 Tax=Sphingomonas silueang TaxID=3156617 RepID=UPI0032B45883